MILSSMSIQDIWDTHNHCKMDIWVKPNDAKLITWAYSLGNKCIPVLIYPEILEKFNMDISYQDTYGHIIPGMGYKPIKIQGDGEVIVDQKFHIWIPSDHSYILQKYVRPDIIFVGNLLRVQSSTKGIRFV